MICIVMWTLLKMVNNLRCWRFCIYALCIIVNKTSAMPFVACKFLNRQPMMSFLHISTFVLCAHTVCIAQTVQVAQMHSEQWTLCDHKWLHWFKQTRARENSQIGISFELLDRFYRLISLISPFSSSVLNQHSTISISGKECSYSKPRSTLLKKWYLSLFCMLWTLRSLLRGKQWKLGIGPDSGTAWPDCSHWTSLSAAQILVNMGAVPFIFLFVAILSSRALSFSSSETETGFSLRFLFAIVVYLSFELWKTIQVSWWLEARVASSRLSSGRPPQTQVNTIRISPYKLEIICQLMPKY